MIGFKTQQLEHGVIYMLPQKVDPKKMQYEFDCIELCGDYVVFANSEAIKLCQNGETISVKELAERNGK